MLTLGILFQVVVVTSYFNNYHFHYSHEPQNKCNFKAISPSTTKLTILVKTSSFHFLQRGRVRSTWKPKKHINHLEYHIIFLLGYVFSPLIQYEIDVESSKYKDILQANFSDTYHNLTVKTVMGFRWAVENCDKSDFFLVIDDDMGISLENMFPRLKNFKRGDHLYMGHQCETVVPERRPTDKYYITYIEYPEKVFPNYVEGPAMVLSSFTLTTMTDMFPKVKPIWLQDVYLGIIAKAVNITITHNKHFHITSGGDDAEKEAWNAVYIPKEDYYQMFPY